MATGSRVRLSYHRRLFLGLLLFLWTLVGSFVLFQYGREKRFKVERLDDRLQLVNLRVLDAYAAGEAPERIAARCGGPFDDLRITLIDRSGRVLFDNSLDTLPDENHLGRPEVVAALRDGTGYTIRRHSESTHRNYFYSAMADDAGSSARPYPIPCRSPKSSRPIRPICGSCWA